VSSISNHEYRLVLSQLTIHRFIEFDRPLQLSDPHARTFSTAELRKAMLSTLAHINLITSQVTTETGHHFDPHLMNFVVSDGENVVATR